MKEHNLKTAIIFGVGGQDGSYLAEYLLELGYKVVGVVRRSSLDNQTRLTQSKHSDSFLVIEGDISDYISVSYVFKRASIFLGCQPREVYNLAAQSHVATSFEQPIYTLRTNAEGILNILEVIRHEGDPSFTRAYQASSSEQFGGVPGTEPQNEDTPFAPKSPYAIAKLAAHNYVQLYRQMYGMFVCAGILFNHEGPRRGENFVTRKITKYVAWLSQQLKDGAPVQKLQLGNMDARRDWGLSSDYVKAMHLMLQQEEPSNYVISTGETHTVQDFLEEAFRCINIDNWSQYVEVNPDFMRPAEVHVLRGDSSKAHKELGWKPAIVFKELVRIMVESDMQALGTK